MTPAQANWLGANRTYRAAHQTGGTTRFVERTMLHPDGTTHKIIRGQAPPVMVGSFEVGILETRDPATGQWIRA